MFTKNYIHRNSACPQRKIPWMSRRPFFSFFSPLFSVFFLFLFLSFFEKHVKVRYRQQRVCDADAQEDFYPSGPADARTGTCRRTPQLLGVGARALPKVWPHVAQVKEHWVTAARICGVPLRWPSQRPPMFAPSWIPLCRSTHRGGSSGCRELELFPFAYSVSLWICHLNIVPNMHCWLTPNRKASPDKATCCAPAVSHRRAGRKKQVIKGQVNWGDNSLDTV